MPFQSDKQRRYMHANLPDIANRWEAKYGLGGIAELNSQLNSLPEYYLPKNQGGRIGFDSGTNGITLGSDKYNITFEPGASGSLSSRDLGEGYEVDQKNIAYGVDTTANIGPIGIGIDYKKFLDKYDVTKDDVTVEKDTERDRQIAYMLDLDLDTLYAKIDSDRDFKNFYLTLRYEFNQGGVVPAHQAGIYGLAEGGRTGFFTGMREAEQQAQSSGGNGGYQNVHQTGAVTQTPGRTTTTTVERDDGDAREKYISEQYKKKRDIYAGTDSEEQQEIDKRNALRKLQQGNISKIERRNLEVGLGLRAAKPKSSFMSWVKNAALAIIPGLLPAKLATAWKVGQGVVDYRAGRYDKYLPAQFKSDSKFATNIANTVAENAEKRKTDKAEQDLINSLPRGHPERIQLEELKKEAPDDVHERDGAIQETGTSITIDAEEVNDAKTQLLRKYQEMNDASRLAWQRQQQMNRDKQMAYYRMMMKPYFTGAAQGGRIPGYNTGGLSNLFRLKNR